MGCEPKASADVFRLAAPEPSSATVPKIAAPSLNVTFPVEVPAPGAVAVTVLVNVTDCPKTDGFTDEASELPVAAWLTICVTVPDVLAVKFVSALYVAVIE